MSVIKKLNKMKISKTGAVIIWALASMTYYQFYTCSGAKSSPASDLAPIDFKSNLNYKKGTLLDVRTPQETSMGYIKGAIFMNINDNDFTQKIATLDKSKPIFVYCRSGRRSRNALAILVTKGFSEVYNLDGGITAWQSDGYPIEIPDKQEYLEPSSDL